MLVENTSRFTVGDTIVIKSNRQVGTVIRQDGDKWVIKSETGAEMLKESFEIEKRQMLFE